MQGDTASPIGAAMTETVEPLIADLVEWVSKAPRSYSEVMDAWRTSCPRLTVWEDAVDRGYLVRERVEGGTIAVRVTPKGQEFLAERAGASAETTATTS
jgi:hypothetical protein